MNMKSKKRANSFFIMALVYIGIMIAFLVTNGNLGGVSASINNPATLPPPPTPGAEPTSIPRLLESLNPIVDRDAAIDRALLIDSSWTVRDKVLMREDLFKEPDMIVVEWYSTRQEASNKYGFGTYDKIEGSEPVWVVIIKGLVTVNDFHGTQTVEGVTYIISQNSGDLLSYATGVIQKQE